MIFPDGKGSVADRVLQWIFFDASGNIIGKIAGIVLRRQNGEIQVGNVNVQTGEFIKFCFVFQK